MPGIFHAIFGLMVAVPIWYMTGKKRYSVGLVVTFAINNYVGPDIGYSVIGKLGSLVGWQGLVDIGRAVHTYFGWMLFSLVWAPLWWMILKDLSIELTPEHVQ